MAVILTNDVDGMVYNGQASSVAATFISIATLTDFARSVDVLPHIKMEWVGSIEW